MQLTFQFIIGSLQLLLPNDFYLFPLVLFSFLILLNIIKRLFKFGSEGGVD